MLTLKHIYKIMAETPEPFLWLPDFSHCEIPTWKNGKHVPYTEEGFRFYLRWLLRHMDENDFRCNVYQREILKYMEANNLLPYATVMVWAGVGYFWSVDEEHEFPRGFLKHLSINKLANEDVLAAKKYLPDFQTLTSLSEEEKLQVILVFFIHAREQKKKWMRLKGAKWMDIGWRPLLKAAMAHVNKYKIQKRKEELLRDFIDGALRLQSRFPEKTAFKAEKIENQRKPFGHLNMSIPLTPDEMKGLKEWRVKAEQVFEEIYANTKIIKEDGKFKRVRNDETLK